MAEFQMVASAGRLSGRGLAEYTVHGVGVLSRKAVHSGGDL